MPVSHLIVSCVHCDHEPLSVHSGAFSGHSLGPGPVPSNQVPIPGPGMAWEMWLPGPALRTRSFWKWLNLQRGTSIAHNTALHICVSKESPWTLFLFLFFFFKIQLPDGAQSQACQSPLVSRCLWMLLLIANDPSLDWLFSPLNPSLLGPPVTQEEQPQKLEVRRCQISQGLPAFQNPWPVSQYHQWNPNSLQWSASIDATFLLSDKCYQVSDCWYCVWPRQEERLSHSSDQRPPLRILGNIFIRKLMLHWIYLLNWSSFMGSAASMRQYIIKKPYVSLLRILNPVERLRSLTTSSRWR